MWRDPQSTRHPNERDRVTAKQFSIDLPRCNPPCFTPGRDSARIDTTKHRDTNPGGDITMTSFDNENPVSSTAAAAAPETETPKKPEEVNAAEAHAGKSHGSAPDVAPTPAPAAPPVKAEDAHAAAEAEAKSA